MSAGAGIRRLFGPYERQVSAAYRSIYIDIAALASLVKRWQPVAINILEVGCGEGQVTEQLRAAFPGAAITAIDITPRLGRLYRGANGSVRFKVCTVQDLAMDEPMKFDLVVLSDVIHHVPNEHRQELLNSCKRTMTNGAVLVFKDWEPSYTPIHWMAYLSDRWLTGDRIRYLRRSQMHELLIRTFGMEALVAEERILPWKNNLAILVRK